MESWKGGRKNGGRGVGCADRRKEGREECKCKRGVQEGSASARWCFLHSALALFTWGDILFGP